MKANMFYITFLLIIACIIIFILFNYLVGLVYLNKRFVVKHKRMKSKRAKIDLKYSKCVNPTSSTLTGQSMSSITNLIIEIDDKDKREKDI